MTDHRKILHTIEVLTEIEARMDDCGDAINQTCTSAQNIVDLITLLQTPHDTGKKERSHTPGCTMLVELLHDLIKQRKPNVREVDLLAWAYEMDKILRIDRRTPEQLEEVIRWCQQDNFWQNNVLSPAKLRKQLDRLELQMGKDFHWQMGKLKRTVQTGPSVKDKYLMTLEKQDGVDQIQSN